MSFRPGFTPHAVLTLFLARALVPVGFMPAALADGGPFVLCHGFSATTLELLDTAHADHAGMHQGHLAPGIAFAAPASSPAAPDHTGHSDAWAQCPLGVGASDAPLAPEIATVTAGPQPLPEPSFSARFRAAPAASSYHARAPPPALI